MTSPPETEYIPRDDESELARIEGGSDINLRLTEEEVKEYSMNDFGLALNSTDFMIPRVPRS